jgi:hypothetical protein
VPGGWDDLPLSTLRALRDFETADERRLRMGWRTRKREKTKTGSGFRIAEIAEDAEQCREDRAKREATRILHAVGLRLELFFLFLSAFTAGSAVRKLSFAFSPFRVFAFSIPSSIRVHLRFQPVPASSAVDSPRAECS